MAQAASQDRQCTIGGQPLTLRFSTKAFAALQDLWQCKRLEDVLKRIDEMQADQAIPLTTAGDLLWAASRAYHPELTRDAVEDILDDAGIAAVPETMGHVFEAMRAAMPKVETPARPRKPAGKGRK